MQKEFMEQYQPPNSIDPSLPAPHFFSTTTTAASASSDPPVVTELPPVLNFTPAHPAVPNQTSYDGMIISAISALREKDGSSRQAIAKYIDRVYNNLPSNHSVLLTNHLKRLKNSGQITMVKHSYMLPSGSAPPPPPPSAATPPTLYTTTTATYSFIPTSSAPTQFIADTEAPPFSTTTTDGVPTLGASPPPSQQKKRGRPPKPKSDLPSAHSAQNYAPSDGPIQTQNYASGPIGSVQNISDWSVEASSKRKPGRPRKEKPSEAQYIFPTAEAQNDSFPLDDAPIQPAATQDYANPSVVDHVGDVGTGAPFFVQANGGVSGSEAMLVSLGLSDGPSPAKMRPRRSKKPTIAASEQQAAAQAMRKKRPGRPRKFKPAVAPSAPGVWPVQVPVGTSAPPSSRGRGRPRKYAVAPPQPGVPPPPNGAVNGLQTKKRGRKPKNATQATSFSVPVSFMLPEQMNTGGAAMIPQAPYVQVGGDASAAAGQGQVAITAGFNGAAYPSAMKRGRGRPPRTNGGGLQKKPRKLSGKPVGRPRKNHAPSEDQSFEIVYLKNKLDYFQSKIIEAVPVIKSYLNGEEANAMEALGQLEDLATLDLRTPAVKVQAQEQQPPAEQLQAEQQ